MINKIVFCTLRDNKKSPGGPSGVNYMLSLLIGNRLGNLKCVYRFNMSKYGWRFRFQINILLFKLSCLLDRKTFYVCHDVVSASVLAGMHKPYSLVYHNQGPLAFEKENFGIMLSNRTIKKWKAIEYRAFTNAISLHFPSKGAEEMYFENKYASCTREDVRLNSPLYNSIYITDSKPMQDIHEDSNSLTFLSLGTLTKNKGQDRSIQFIESYLESHPRCKIRYIVVGRGPLQESVTGRGRALMEKYPNFMFYFFPSLKHEEVMYLHKISDVYLMLHRLSVFDIATLEAMCSHSAIVLSPVGGNFDFNKKHNIIYASNDYNEAINLLSKDNISYMKEINYNVYTEFFSNDAFVDAYRRMIENSIKTTERK